MYIMALFIFAFLYKNVQLFVYFYLSVNCSLSQFMESKRSAHVDKPGHHSFLLQGTWQVCSTEIITYKCKTGKYITTQGKCYHKVYTLFQANFKVSYEARYNVTEFIVLKHMHISIKKKKKLNRSLLNINSFHVHLENSKYKIL